MRNVPPGRFGEGQLAKLTLDGNLPRTHCGQEQLSALIFDKGKVITQPLGLGLEPQKHVGVEEQTQEIQASNVASRVSGRGASKSSGTSQTPRSIPRRRAPCRRAGTRRAISSPRRVIEISSPASTRSSSFERLVFASCTPTDLVMDLVYTDDQPLIGGGYALFTVERFSAACNRRRCALSSSWRPS